MDYREHETIETASTPVQPEENMQAFLRYLPRRIADFERRILRYRFAGWDPNGMVVLTGDARRLADASASYGLIETREHLLALAQMVSGHSSSMRAPDPKQAERMFALLSAVIRSLPLAVDLPLHAATAETSSASDVRPVAEALLADDAPVTVDEVQAPVEPTLAETAGSEVTVAAADPPANAMELDPAESITPPEAVAPTATDAPAETPSLPTLVEPAQPVVSQEPASPDAPIATPESAARMEPAELEVSPDPVASAGPVEADAPVVPAALEASVEQATPNTSLDAAGPVDPIAFDDAREPEAVGGLGMRRIFHLSDGNAFAAELGQRLESEGYAIEPVESVEELSELLTCLMPHMLLVDASHVSEATAIDALRHDAEQHSQPPRHIQMVVMAAQDSMDVRRAAHRVSADLLLFPPFDIAGVSGRLQALHASAAAEPVRVLVVDDERTDALFAQAVLNRAGMQARVEHDSMQVLEALRSQRPDLILMDLHMPVANGVEVTMLIREQPQFARIPIVFLSGESDPDSQLEAINAGGDDFLFKPIRPRHLIAAVQDRVRRLHAVDKPNPQTHAPPDASGV